MAKAVAEAKRLDPPYPSSPHRPPAFTLHWQRDDRKSGVHTFAARYSAQRFLLTVIGDDTYKWLKDDTIVTESGVTLRTISLDALIEYTPTKRELEWVMDDHHQAEANAIRTGKRTVIAAPEPTPDAPKERTPRTAPEGMITIAALADKLKLKPRDARALLRKHKIQKPTHGWAWSTQDATAIEQTLKGKS